MDDILTGCLGSRKQTKDEVPQAPPEKTPVTPIKPKGQPLTGAAREEEIKEAWKRVEAERQKEIEKEPGRAKLPTVEQEIKSFVYLTDKERQYLRDLTDSYLIGEVSYHTLITELNKYRQKNAQLARAAKK